MKLKVTRRIFFFIMFIVVIYQTILINIGFKEYLWSTFLIIIICMTYHLYKIGKVYLKYFFNYMLNGDNKWWEKQVERPRLLFYLLFIPTIVIFSFLIYSKPYSIINPRLDYYLFYLFQYIYLSLIASSLYILFFTWTKEFKDYMIPTLKYYLDSANTYPCNLKPNEYDIKSLYEELVTEELACEYEVFLDMINLYKINPSKRIIWKSTTVNLIRFIFIIFDIPANDEHQILHKPIKERISNYFVDIHNREIKLTEKGSEISQRKEEKRKMNNSEYKRLKEKTLKYKIKH